MLALTVAFLSETTCGEACWHAKEKICKCICGGKNHGILKSTGEQPTRTCKIDGYRYELLAVGERKQLHDEINRLMKALPYRTEHTEIDYQGKKYEYQYTWKETSAGSPIRIKYATAIQCEKWSELSQFKGLEHFDFYEKSPTLIWKKLD